MSRIPRFVISVLAFFATIVISFVPVVQAAKPLKIGFSMALTGPLGPAGKAALLAMQIWRDNLNAKGGLLGRKIELVYYDDQTKPANVPGIYAKLLDVDKVDFVVSGAQVSSVSLSFSPNPPVFFVQLDSKLIVGPKKSRGWVIAVGLVNMSSTGTSQ